MALVKVSVDVFTVASSVSLLEISKTTFPVGCESSTTVKFCVVPVSETVRVVSETVYPAARPVEHKNIA